MAKISLDAMKDYLTFRQRKLKVKEPSSTTTKFKSFLNNLGLQKRFSQPAFLVSQGWDIEKGWLGWLLFNETINPVIDYSNNRQFPFPDFSLHIICATFHQLGIHSYFCTPIIEETDNAESIKWHFAQLGLPMQSTYKSFPEGIQGFRVYPHRHSLVQHNLDVSAISNESLPELFSKEHLRESFQNKYMVKTHRVDGIYWGNHSTYPLEIIEKTAGRDNKTGTYFNVDIDSFTNLTSLIAKKTNFYSAFVVREIDNLTDQNLVGWWIITYKQLSKFASRNSVSSKDVTIKIPKSEFLQVNLANLNSL